MTCLVTEIIMLSACINTVVVLLHAGDIVHYSSVCGDIGVACNCNPGQSVFDVTREFCKFCYIPKHYIGDKIL